jgi:hypothetical protein
MASPSTTSGGMNRKYKRTFGKSLLDGARIAGKKALKESKRKKEKESTCDDVLGKFDMMA